MIKEAWFAWYPVRTEQRRWAWWRKVIRVWDPEMTPLQYPGVYNGGWRYHG